MRRFVRLIGPLTGGLIAGAVSVASAVPTEPNVLVNPLFEPSECEFCHDYDNAPGQGALPSYSPFRTWQGSMMANAARDPVFWAGVGVADQDGGDETILCVRCHAPRAFLEGNGLAKSMYDLTPEQHSGVECELCHRAVDDGVTPPGNAQYVVDDVIANTNVPRRGPWTYAPGDPDGPAHDWLQDTYIGTSRWCGTCHDVTTVAERVDDMGNGLGVPFNEQRTYSEWLGSAYAQAGPDFASCQDCHMPAVADMPGCAQNVITGGHPTGGRRHDLVGANRFMVQLLQQEYGSAGTNTIGDIYYETTLDRIDEFLATAATLEVTGPDEVDLTAGLPDVQVVVTNQTGHKLPSGYSEGRVMWLEVEAAYAGTVVYTSGAWDPVAGIEQDAQLRTYQGIGEQYSTGTTFHLLLNDHWVEDTRIPPLGLQPDLETDPVGDRYTLLPDGTWPNFDTHAYAFGPAPEIYDVTPGDANDDVLMVTVRLRYLINTPEYIDFLASSGTDAGLELGMLFDLAGGAEPVTLVEEVLPVPIVGFGSVAGTSSGDGGLDSTTGGSGSAGGTSTGSVPGTDGGPGTTGSIGTTTGTTGTDTDGGASADGDDGACACRQRSGGGAMPWLWVGLGAALRRRRRRRAHDCA